MECEAVGGFRGVYQVAPLPTLSQYRSEEFRTGSKSIEPVQFLSDVLHSARTRHVATGPENIDEISAFVSFMSLLADIPHRLLHPVCYLSFEDANRGLPPLLASFTQEPSSAPLHQHKRAIVQHNLPLWRAFKQVDQWGMLLK